MRRDTRAREPKGQRVPIKKDGSRPLRERLIKGPLRLNGRDAPWAALGRLSLLADLPRARTVGAHGLRSSLARSDPRRSPGEAPAEAPLSPGRGPVRPTLAGDHALRRRCGRGSWDLRCLDRGGVRGSGASGAGVGVAEGLDRASGQEAPRPTRAHRDPAGV